MREPKIRWRKSSRSSSSAHCVEVGTTPNAVHVRDTKDRAGGMLRLDRRQWGSFLRDVKGVD